MAIQILQHDVLQDEEFSEVREFLAEHQLRPDDEEAILKAIADRGWELHIEGTPGDWSVKIREYGTSTSFQDIIAHEPDRRRMLFRAVRMALSWLTPRQEREAFDRATRAVMGIPADEFMMSLEAGGLNLDDPHVRHLLMLRPVGW